MNELLKIKKKFRTEQVRYFRSDSYFSFFCSLFLIAKKLNFKTNKVYFIYRNHSSLLQSKNFFLKNFEMKIFLKREQMDRT